MLPLLKHVRKIVDDIRTARQSGVVRCGISVRPSPSLPELAAEFRLSNNPSSYREIDATAARRLAESILARDLAYDVEIMPSSRAAEFAGLFLDSFGSEGVNYFTNGTFQDSHRPKRTGLGVQWNPVTSATFDTGVLVIGQRRSGCLWVEDED